MPLRLGLGQGLAYAGLSLPPIIGGTGPVLATLAGGDNLNTRVTWGTYTPTAPAVSINSPTVKEYRVRAPGGSDFSAWTTFGSFSVAEGQTIEVREIVTDNTGRQRTFNASPRVVEFSGIFLLTIDGPELVFSGLGLRLTEDNDLEFF